MKAELAQRDDKALYNLRKFYNKPEISNESLDECVSRFRVDIWEAVKQQNPEMERVYKLHLKVVKEVLTTRRWWV